MLLGWRFTRAEPMITPAEWEETCNGPWIFV